MIDALLANMKATMKNSSLTQVIEMKKGILVLTSEKMVNLQGINSFFSIPGDHYQYEVSKFIGSKKGKFVYEIKPCTSRMIEKLST